MNGTCARNRTGKSVRVMRKLVKSGPNQWSVSTIPSQAVSPGMPGRFTGIRTLRLQPGRVRASKACPDLDAAELGQGGQEGGGVAAKLRRGRLVETGGEARELGRAACGARQGQPCRGVVVGPEDLFAIPHQLEVDGREEPVAVAGGRGERIAVSHRATGKGPGAGTVRTLGRTAGLDELDDVQDAALILRHDRSISHRAPASLDPQGAGRVLCTRKGRAGFQNATLGHETIVVVPARTCPAAWLRQQRVVADA